MDMKEESYFVDFCSENEEDTKILVKNFKIETSDCDTKAQLEDSTCGSQHHLMRVNETIKEGELETKIDIKEEHWCLERPSYIHNDIKVETHQEFYSTNPPSEYKESVSICTSDSEVLVNDISFNMKKDGPECKHDMIYQSQKGVVTDIPSTETSVCSENSDNGKIVNTASSSKLRKLLEQTNKQETNKNCKSILSHGYRKSYKADVSEICSKHLSHLQKYRLTVGSEEAQKYDVWDKDLNQLSLETHTLIDDGKSPHESNIYKAFTELSNLRKSKLIHEGIKSHRCDICNKAFTQLSSLKMHRLFHEGIRPHKCNICNKAFTKSSDLKRHKLVHQNIKSHICDICNKPFTTLAYLKKHKLIHEGIKKHRCNICNKAFIHLPNLIRHKLIHVGTKSHKCTICNKAFAQLSYLKTHMLIHDGIKPHKCDICSKPFSDSSSLKRHKMIHEGIKPHKCIICSRAFTQLSQLKSHKLIHAGIKPYKCDICNKAFARLSQLKLHKLIHEGIKPHKCDICNKAFTQLSNLKNHKLIHAGIKSNQCGICNKTFTRLSRLKIHKLVHEGVMPYKCKECSKTFTHMSSLIRHIDSQGHTSMHTTG